VRAYRAIHGFLAREHADSEVSFKAVIGGLLLLVAYMAYPEPFHEFGRFIVNTLLESVRDAFGTSSDGGAKDPGQIRIKGHSGG